MFICKMFVQACFVLRYLFQEFVKLFTVLCTCSLFDLLMYKLLHLYAKNKRVMAVVRRVEDIIIVISYLIYV
jgi:hypothetical protein